MVQPDPSFDRLIRDTKVSDAVGDAGAAPVVVRLDTTLRVSHHRGAATGHSYPLCR